MIIHTIMFCAIKNIYKKANSYQRTPKMCHYAKQNSRRISVKRCIIGSQNGNHCVMFIHVISNCSGYMIKTKYKRQVSFSLAIQLN